jgi:DNA-binding NtrC family response regulator
MKQVEGKIVLVDDEKYELDLLAHALKKKNWDIQIAYFNNVEDALEHLKKNRDEIFLIISDMDMPKINGMDFKKIIDNDEYLKQKAVPFIFATNSIGRETIVEAYHYRVQGYFKKPNDIEGQATMLETIIQYWIACEHPNKEDIS